MERRRANVFVMEQNDAPASIVGANFKTGTDILPKAFVRNNSNREIVGYRIGRAIVGQMADSPSIVVGDLVNLAAEAKPLSLSTSPPQNIALSTVPQRTAGVVFFIAEVRFTKGDNWKANEKLVWENAKTEVIEQHSAMF